MSAAAAGSIHGDLREAYEAIAYVGRPNHYSEPSRLHAIALLHGLDRKSVV